MLTTWMTGCGHRLFGFDDLADLPLVGTALAEARALTAEPPRVRHETIRRVINAMVHDVIVESSARLAALAPADVEAVRDAGGPVIGFSETMQATNRVVKAFLHERMYRHWRVNRMSYKARGVTRALAALLLARPDLLPEDWQAPRRRGRSVPHRGDRAGLRRRHDGRVRGRRAPPADRSELAGLREKLNWLSMTQASLKR